jgi:hypothetical protein
MFLQVFASKISLPLQNAYLFLFLTQFIGFFLYYEEFKLFTCIQAILVFIPYFDKEKGIIDEFIK